MSWTFASCLGQSQIIDRLVREVAGGRLAHAYMLEGAPGVGKLTLAHALSAFILCTDRRGNDACGVCRSCRLLSGGNHPDYLELPRDTTELLLARFVERTVQVEAQTDEPLLTFLRLKPVESALRVAVIPDAERMRPESANAFLKTLEEPPGQSLILLTTSNRDRLPATISSRCRRLGLSPLSSGVIARELTGRGLASSEAAEGIAIAAEGSLGYAMRLSGGDTLDFWRWLDGEAFCVPGPGSAKRLADAMIRYGGSSSDAAGKRRRAIEAIDLSALALRRGLRRGMSARGVSQSLEALWTAADQIVKNVRPDLVLLSASFEVMAALRRHA